MSLSKQEDFIFIYEEKQCHIYLNCTNLLLDKLSIDLWFNKGNIFLIKGFIYITSSVDKSNYKD